jgi:2-C-methyl-D-erythritol 4-phosphate cytidylyltransferase
MISDTRPAINHRQIAAVIPAAGVGKRMQSELPKQYLQLHGKTILEHSANVLLQLPLSLVIALSPDDPYFAKTSLAANSAVQTVTGGAERADSVLAALQLVNAEQFPWVLVHDAARPLVQLSDIQQLITQCLESGCGGILAYPVRDTMKRGQQRVECTVERADLWHALTPQLFPTALLRQALSEALAAGIAITDEASAMEWAGLPVQLVAGRSDNIKVTRPEDLALAGFYLENRA